MRSRIGWILMAAVIVLATPVAVLARDDRNDNDRDREQRNDREDFVRMLVYRQLMQQQYLGNQVATYQYLQQVSRRHALRAVGVPSGWFPSKPTAIDTRASALTFRESPGERELEIAQLYVKSDATLARTWLNKAIEKAGNNSEVAEIARKHLKAIAENP